MADRITVIPKKIVTVIEPHKSTLVDREKYRQTRVAAYCRVSTDSEEQLTSYKTQKKVYILTKTALFRKIKNTLCFKLKCSN